MTYYQVRLEGRDFPMMSDGKEKIMGFVTTRWVKAASDEEAELKAVELIKRDKRLVDAIQKKEGITPMIYLVELAVVSWFDFFRRQPGGGYTFYIQNNEH